MDEAGEALAEVDDGVGTTTGGLAGLEGAEVDIILMPLLIFCMLVVVGGGVGEEEEWLLPIRANGVEDSFSNPLSAAEALTADSVLVLIPATDDDLIGKNDVDVAEVTVTEDAVDVADVVDGCKTTKVAAPLDGAGRNDGLE